MRSMMIVAALLATGGAALAQAKPPVVPPAKPAATTAQAAPAAPAAPAKPPEAPQAPVSATPQATTAIFGDWVLRCRRVDGSPANAPASCEVAQTLQLQGQGPIAEIAIGRPPGKDFTTKEPIKLVVVVPNNVTFSGPVVLAMDDKDKGVELGFRRCLPSGCFADADARDDVMAKWRVQAERGRILYRDGANRDITLPFSFRGLAQALDAMAKP